jgi:actin-like ATPase involved in cell morphogenesis
MGVDIGTLFTAAAVERDGRVQPLELGTRSLDIPSVVFIGERGERVVGETAERRGALQPDRLAREFKRRVGDPVPLVAGGVPVPAHALMSTLLEWVVGEVTAREGRPPDHVMVAVPGNWADHRREVLAHAVRSVVAEAALLPAPEAAAAQFASTRQLRTGETVAIYNLGGGTFDAALLRRTDDGFEFLGTPHGFERLGGTDFDDAVFGHIRRLLGPAVADLDADDPAIRSQLARLRSECIAAKEALTRDTEVVIPVLLAGQRTQVRLERDEFEAMIRPAIGQTVELLVRTVQRAGLSPEEVDHVFLLGGSSRIPLAGQLVAAAFGSPAVVDRQPQQTVALGAARLGAARANRSRPAPPAPAAAVPTPVPVVPAPAPNPPAPNPPVAPVPEPAPTAPAAPAAAAKPPWRDRVRSVRAAGPPPWLGLALLVLLNAAVITLAAVVLINYDSPSADQARPSDDSQSTPTPTSAGDPGWRAEANYPTTIEAAGAAAWQNRIWVVGGNNASSDRPRTAAVYSYDPATPEKGWSEGPLLPKKMDHLALIATDTSLYTLGGADGEATYRSVYRLDKPDGRWVRALPLPAPRQAGAAVWDSYRQRILYGGGARADGTSAREVWALDGDAWRLVGRLQKSRNHLAATADGNGNVYFVGGENGGNKKGHVYGYVDVVRGDEVSSQRNMEPRRAHGAVVLPSGGLCVFGGVEAGRWRSGFACRSQVTLPPLNPPRAGFAAAELGGRLYVIGGYSPGRAASDNVQSLSLTL